MQMKHNECLPKLQLYTFVNPHFTPNLAYGCPLEEIVALEEFWPYGDIMRRDGALS